GQRTGPARGVHPAAGGDAVRQQPLDPAQPHRLRGSRRARAAAALCPIVAAMLGVTARPGSLPLRRFALHAIAVRCYTHPAQGQAAVIAGSDRQSESPRAATSSASQERRGMASNLDPKQDYVFKRLFGDEDNALLLVGLLNAVLDFVAIRRVRGVLLLNPFVA